MNSIVGFTKDKIIVERADMNHATEVFSFDTKSKKWEQITHVNDKLYAGIAMSKTEKRYVTTTDGKKMLVWVILPPNFDANKKYPALLYCQGGPQSALTQFYSYRWNFQVMAANGYIVVAPNRRGMPGHGVAWNEAISKDWGGQVMDDYLSAIDDVAKESYVDKARLGAVGASLAATLCFTWQASTIRGLKPLYRTVGYLTLKACTALPKKCFLQTGTAEVPIGRKTMPWRRKPIMSLTLLTTLNNGIRLY